MAHIILYSGTFTYDVNVTVFLCVQRRGRCLPGARGTEVSWGSGRAQRRPPRPPRFDSLLAPRPQSLLAVAPTALSLSQRVVRHWLLELISKLKLGVYMVFMGMGILAWGGGGGGEEEKEAGRWG